MADPYQEVVDDLDLPAAVRRGSQRNDLLPPRVEDDVLGEVGNRFSESLKDKLRRGRYDPNPAEIVLVPKPGNTTRPAALLTLSDRVVFDAIVETLRPRIETALLGRQIVLWPRGLDAEKRWGEFESSSLSGTATHVVLADVTGFYETIDHERLRDVLIAMTGRRRQVNALIEFLGRVMGSRRGVPQGLAASDPIATAYLSPVDSAMARSGLEYVRHGDDVRIAVRSVSEAREVLYNFEQQLRRVGLLANGSKAIIMRRSSYEKSVARPDQVHEKAQQELLAERIAEVEDDGEKLGELLEEIGEEQLAWNLFYHGNTSISDVIDQIKVHLSPDDMAVALRVLTAAILPDAKLTREEIHIRVSSALIRLAAGRSPLAIPFVEELLTRFPEKTEVVAAYLAAQKATEWRAVSKELLKMLSQERFQTDWETAWLLTATRKFVGHLGARQRAVIRGIAMDEGRSMFCRVEALKILAQSGEISNVLVRRLWSMVPVCFQPDLVAAVHYGRSAEPWCEAFLAGVREDPVNNVVVRKLQAHARIRR